MDDAPRRADETRQAEGGLEWPPDPQPGDLYRDRFNSATFRVESYDREGAWVHGVRSDFGPWHVRRASFDRYYQRVREEP